MHLNEPYVYKSIDYQSIVDKTCSNSSTNYDISSFKGLINTIYVIHQTDANKSTAKDYFAFSNLTELTLKADGEELYKLYSTVEEAIFDTWVSHGRSSTGISQVGASGHVFAINLGFHHMENYHIPGGLQTRRINHLEIDATGQASSVISFVAERSVELIIEKGDLKVRYI